MTEEDFLNDIINLTRKYNKDFESIKRKGWIGPIVIGEKVKVITVDKYVTHEQLKAMNFVTMDKLKAMNFVTKDYVDKRFEQVDKRFEQVDKRFEQIEKRLDSLEQKVDLIEQKLDLILSKLS